MIVTMWGIIVIIALVPSALIGWLVGKIPIPTIVCGIVLTGLGIFAGLAASMYVHPHATLALKYHYENLVGYLPPFLSAMILGLWISRVK